MMTRWPGNGLSSMSTNRPVHKGAFAQLLQSEPDQMFQRPLNCFKAE